MQKKYFFQLLFILLIHSINSLGMGTKSCGDGMCRGRIAIKGSNTVKAFDTQLLNIKPTQANSVTETLFGPINITQTQFQSLATAGNTWMGFGTSNDHITMNIGISDNVNSQTWTLPSNIFSVFEYYDRNDFIAIASLPNYLDAPAGTTHIMKSPVQNYDGFDGENYQYYSISTTDITFLGEDYDFDGIADEDYDSEPDFKFADVPLSLNDNYSSTTEFYDIRRDGSLKKEVNAVTVDGFGTLATPDGTFECLRVKYVVNKYIRGLVTDPFPTTPTSTYTRMQWVAANGYTFEGIVVSENPTTHEAVLSELSLSKIVPTSSLTEMGDVKLNNDSKGVTINSLNETADPSAILDINSDNLGILIPRIAMANRPSTPATGLLVYQIDNTAGFYYFDGTSWQRLSSQPPVSVSARVNTENSDIRGNSQLNNGTAFIKFDFPKENFDKLQLNIQLEGDCNGVYISKKTKEGFEVRELQKGKSNVKFSWSLHE